MLQLSTILVYFFISKTSCCIVWSTILVLVVLSVPHIVLASLVAQIWNNSCHKKNYSWWSDIRSDLLCLAMWSLKSFLYEVSQVGLTYWPPRGPHLQKLIIEHCLNNIPGHYLCYMIGKQVQCLPCNRSFKAKKKQTSTWNMIINRNFPTDLV